MSWIPCLSLPERLITLKKPTIASLRISFTLLILPSANLTVDSLAITVCSLKFLLFILQSTLFFVSFSWSAVNFVEAFSALTSRILPLRPIPKPIKAPLTNSSQPSPLSKLRESSVPSPLIKFRFDLPISEFCKL